jgi:hypothetical protein
MSGSHSGFAACSLIALALASALPVAARAATFRVDDSGTRVSAPLVPMRWRTLVPGRGSDNTAEGQAQIAVRLNVLPWINQRGRIYLTLGPAPSGDTIRATWRTQGRLLPGSVQSGGRTVIYEGALPSPTLEETIELTITADGRGLAAPQSLQFSFEIETP